MNRLDTKTRARIVACLVEGNSVRATCRLTGAAKGTVLKLLVEIGQACSEYQHRTLRGLSCKRIQCDEIWSFCYAKDKNVPSSKADPGAVGSIWTWTAIDADSKLMVSYHIGTRDAGCAHHFMRDVSRRLAHRVQLTTDGYKPCLEATYSAFEGEVDYAMLVESSTDRNRQGRAGTARRSASAPGSTSSTASRTLTTCPRATWSGPT